VAGKKKLLGVVVAVLVLLLMAAPILYQQMSKTTLDEQAPPLIESWLLQAFPEEFEAGMVKGVEAPRTFSSEVHLPATVMTKTGSLKQVCVTFKREGLFGDWFAVGECVPDSK